MLPIDVVGVVSGRLSEEIRPFADGKLHPSSDLIGSLRHTMLNAAGAPTIESKFTQNMTLWIGRQIHAMVGESLERRGIPVMREVRLEPWLPDGWSGTADLIFYDPSKDGWVLADVKGQKGESFRWLHSDGAKEEHIWQASAYWWALYEMGLPMVDGFTMIYLPKNDTTDKWDIVEPLTIECNVLPYLQVWDRMESRWELTQTYLAALPWPDDPGSTILSDLWVTDELAPPQDRVQKMWWNKKQGVWDVKLVPHWSADYCPFPNELCDCSEQGTTKIGHWNPREWEDGVSELVYEPRKGYEAIEPLLKPSAKEVVYRGNDR